MECKLKNGKSITEYNLGYPVTTVMYDNDFLFSKVTYYPNSYEMKTSEIFEKDGSVRTTNV